MFVAHYILNQNARIDTCAYTPAAIPQVPASLIQRELGIIQFPRPELEVLGLGRQGQNCNILDDSSQHDAGEGYGRISVPEGQSRLRSIAENIIYQL